MKNAKRIILIGPMGAGKTSVGQVLAKLLGLQFIDSDHLIEQRLQNKIDEIFRENGEDFFRRQESLVIEESTKLVNVVFATGGGSVLLPHNRTMLKLNSTVLYLKVSPLEQQRRLYRINNRPPLPSNVDDRSEFLLQMLQQRTPLYDGLADVIIDTDNLSIQAVAQLISESICV